MFVRSIEKAETSNRNNRVRELLSFAVLSVLALTLFAGKAHAQIIGDLDANIPFQFHVGNKEFPAGNYRIRTVDNDNLGVMQITSIDSTVSAVFQVHEADANSTPSRTELIFNKYGNNYFLSKLFDEGNRSGSELGESRYEKQVSKMDTVAQESVTTHHRMQQGK